MTNKGHRLSFLIVENEPAQGLSSRKLLIESAKHNVITSHSATEGRQMFERFANVDAIVIDDDTEGLRTACQTRKAKEFQGSSDMPISAHRRSRALG
jgi:CheY-like chemotaxis protein